MMTRWHPKKSEAEIVEAVIRPIREMTREDWQRVNEELSHAPEGVEDPWPPYEWPERNGVGPVAWDTGSAEASPTDVDARKESATPATTER